MDLGDIDNFMLDHRVKGMPGGIAHNPALSHIFAACLELRFHQHHRLRQRRSHRLHHRRQY